MNQDTIHNSHGARRHAIDEVKKSILVFLAGGLAMEWIRLSRRYSRRPKEKKTEQKAQSR